VRLFGQLDLRLGDAELPALESTRAEALLAYLLLHRDAPQATPAARLPAVAGLQRAAGGIPRGRANAHMTAGPYSIREANATHRAPLEALQRRSSDVWEQYRDQLAANPDAIALLQVFINNGWVRVAVAADDEPIGFSVVIPAEGAAHELDGLFVDPGHMHCGVGSALVEDAAARAAHAGAASLEVTAGPAQGFYERVGFTLIGSAETRFGPAVRMRRELAS
jgi:GNAT superfamily N-acetyltransferase